jgi:hypothetical protein
MKNLKQAMKWVTPVLVIVGILIFRQASAEQVAVNNESSHAVLWETNRTYGMEEYGWIILDQNDPKVLAPLFHAFRNQQTCLKGLFLPVLFRYCYHHRTNPLLMDRPPPPYMA